MYSETMVCWKLKRTERGGVFLKKAPASQPEQPQRQPEKQQQKSDEEKQETQEAKAK